ncbi:bacteriorhodopsin [Leptodontidium sp. 2 PMI_412]|nr:bacteriorhodopsin [Leptodontidium sp. 2 PMI_412]
MSIIVEPSSVGPPVPTVSPHPIFQTAGKIGETTLWIVFAIMLLSSITFMFLAYRQPVSKRAFHLTTSLITIFASISYYAMATGDGNSMVSYVVKEHHGKGIQDTYIYIFRQVYWARYIGLSVTTPLLLLDLALLAGLNGANIVALISADVVMTITGLFAGLNENGGQKWGYYTISCIAYLFVIYLLVIQGRSSATTQGPKVGTLFTSLAGFTLIVWTLYPIVWGIGDGARKISVDAEVVSYAILDVLAMPVFGFWLLIAHRNIPAANIHLGGAWAEGFGNREGTLRVGSDDDA